MKFKKSENLNAPFGDEYRLICPLCKTIFSTMEMPATCPNCSAELVIKVRTRRRARA